jgi:hypothetical protein
MHGAGRTSFAFRFTDRLLGLSSKGSFATICSPLSMTDSHGGDSPALLANLSAKFPRNFCKIGVTI